MTDLPILELRRIEARILKHVFDVITERSGREEAEAVVGETCSRSAIEQGKVMADRVSGAPDFNDFREIMPLWTKEGALEIDHLDSPDGEMNFNVTRCRYSEMYREMGLGDIGHLLSCNRDGDFCIGYNPDMKLERTQTIMKGASHCDFRYTLNKES